MPIDNLQDGGQTETQAAPSSLRRASVGRALVAFAVFAPALVILGVFLLSQGKIYGYKVSGAKWPWVIVDVAVLLAGALMMRGEDV